MRAFFLLLLLLNVGVFAVLTMHATGEPEDLPPRPVEGTLTVIDEDRTLAEARDRAEPEEAPLADADASAADGGAAETPTNCYRAEDMDEDAAQALAATARAAAHPASVLTRTDREFIGYWVYIPAHDSREAAQDTMAKLADEGLDDYGYVGGEDNEHAVSLGVFSSESRARSRQETVEALGLPTEKGERYRATRTYGVIVGAESRDELPAADWRQADCQALEG